MYDVTNVLDTLKLGSDVRYE